MGAPGVPKPPRSAPRQSRGAPRVPVRLTGELVRRFEAHMAEAVESLLRASLQVPGNPEGYALFRDGPALATLSTNPRARWATQTFGLTGQPIDVVKRVIDFYGAHGVPACVRIVPVDFTPEQGDLLHDLGLRHDEFQAIAWAPLPLVVEPTSGADIREVASLAEMDAHIDIQLEAYDVPAHVIDLLRPLRRTWLGLPRRRLYLAYVDGQPAAQAILHWSGDLAYLEGAGTRPAFRRRGLQGALIRRRIADAMALGCRVIFGSAEFASQSFANQMACGLVLAYTAARWRQRAPRG